MYMYFFARFAEELMKTECKIPTLHIPMSSTSNRSLSGSSTSFHSSKSGFKDPMLSSFEEELLSTSFGRSSTKSSSIKQKRKKSTGSRVTSAGRVQQSMYFTEMFQETVSDFADRLAQGIVLESIETVLRGSLDSRFSPRDAPFTTSSPIPNDLLNLADRLSSLFLEEAMSAVSDKIRSRQRAEISSDTESCSTEEYSDALDVQCHKVEEFADEVAKRVLETAVKFIIREMECFKKVVIICCMCSLILILKAQQHNFMFFLKIYAKKNF